MRDPNSRGRSESNGVRTPEYSGADVSRTIGRRAFAGRGKVAAAVEVAIGIQRSILNY
jgi:hypothetical protein